VFLLLAVLWTILNSASWVIYLVTALAASQWTNCSLCSCCGPMSMVFNAAPGNWPESNPLWHRWRDSVCIICSWGIGEDNDHGNKWEVLRTISSVPCHNGISSDQQVGYTQDESCWIWMQVAGVSHPPVICNTSVQCCVFVNRDKLRCMTGQRVWLSDINRKLFQG